ncbi:MAG: VOC family protein [Chloroflexi bacterium]|nr:VOC family protein [Chloroflexota bacterium]
MPAPKLNGLAHLVIRVRDIDRSIAFYRDVLGLELLSNYKWMAFFNSPGAGERSHELGIMQLGAEAPGPESGRVGLYHFAWQLATLKELEDFHRHAVAHRTNIVGYGDHGHSFGIYLTDPDGNEIEVFYELPRDQWPDDEVAGGSKFPLPVDIEPVGVRT